MMLEHYLKWLNQRRIRKAFIWKKFMPASKQIIITYLVPCLITYLRTYCVKQSSSWEANPFSAGQEIPRILWNPEGSLSHSQVPATCPCPEQARSSPYAHIPLPENPSEYYPPIYAWVIPVVSFPHVSPPKLFTRLSSPPYVLHAPPISFLSI